MEVERVPWLFAVLTAAWFGWMANRSGRTFPLWAAGGAAFGLVISTLVLGFGHARSIPFLDSQAKMDQAKWVAIAAALIIVIGWLLTSSLHRQHLLLWRKLKPEQGFPETAPTSIKPGPSTSNKPGSGKTQS